MTRFYLFPDDELVKVVDDVKSFRFREGRWGPSTHYAKVTGMGGTCDFEELTTDEAKRRFPDAFAHLVGAGTR